MDIFKLFFDHDLRLDKLRERHTDKEPETGASIEEFMKPIPTYSKFYLTGTLLEEKQFGLNVLKKFDQILKVLSKTFDEYTVISELDHFSSLPKALEQADTGEALLLSNEEDSKLNPEPLKINDDSNVGHRKEELKKMLEQNVIVLYKEKAHHGFDLHLFSRSNIYKELFRPLQKLVDDRFRFFSINSKRMRSEHHFYFETWSLEKPPHGAEEVFPETVI